MWNFSIPNATCFMVFSYYFLIISTDRFMRNCTIPMAFELFVCCNYLITYVFIMCTLSYCSLSLMFCRPITLVIFDSRGTSVAPHFKDTDVICKVFRGARIVDVTLRASRLIQELKPRTCLILAGINDFTYRDKKSRMTKIRITDSFSLANSVISRILGARKLLVNRYPDTKIAFGGINGIHLNRYNKIDGISSNQPAIDEAILQVNTYIRLLNQQMHVYHPRLISKVHTWYKGRSRNNYHLLSDGLHLGRLVSRYWVRSLLRFHRVNTLGERAEWIVSNPPRR